jgi:predicted nucleotidyltransferase
MPKTRDTDDFRAKLKARLQAAYGDRLKGLVLFGSEATGESGPDSDVDVLVLLDGPIRLWEEIERCVDATYALAVEIGRPIHAEPADIAEYERGDFALYRNARAEGVRL